MKANTSRAALMQLPDMAANDNMSPMQELAMARALQDWAAFKANNPAFAPFCHAAVAQAQATFNRFKPRQA